MNCSKEDLTTNLKEYKSLIHRILHNYGVEEDYEDLHQELMLTTWMVLCDNSPQSRYLDGVDVKFSTYLYNVLENRLIDIYRSKNKTRLNNFQKIRKESKKKYPKGNKRVSKKLKLHSLKVYDGENLLIWTRDKRTIIELREYFEDHAKFYPTIRIVKVIGKQLDTATTDLTIEEITNRNLARPDYIDDFTYEQQINMLKEETSAKGIRISADIDGFENTLEDLDREIWNLMLESWNQEEIVRILKERNIADKKQCTISRRLTELKKRFTKYMNEEVI